ncbi:MAG: phytanoyl-CoA dioxygenase family protein [Myxococcales bacterium]|nr:phytanoyl-CoA dioxygenase family protein [Myxococcales bacterium]MCB9642661.1 phytanoyl-CoA dioxygenase family protein [Myxococcales bacterium]
MGQEELMVLEVSDEERSRGVWLRDFRSIYEGFRSSGALLVKGAYRAEKMKKLHELYLEKYANYLDPNEKPDALEVGNLRRMVTVEVAGAFNDPEAYANPFLLPLIQLFTESDAILGGFGSVVSLPGSQDQGVHADHPPLFGEDKFDLHIPCFAILMISPLIEMNDLHGTTAVWPGSHAVPRKEVQQLCKCELPVVEVGDALLMDYRLWHAGTANRSEVSRPVLYSYYARQWFRDCVNYFQQNALEISRDELLKIPESLRYLFMYAHLKRTA